MMNNQDPVKNEATRNDKAYTFGRVLSEIRISGPISIIVLILTIFMDTSITFNKMSKGKTNSAIQVVNIDVVAYVLSIAPILIKYQFNFMILVFAIVTLIINSIKWFIYLILFLSPSSKNSSGLFIVIVYFLLFHNLIINQILYLSLMVLNTYMIYVYCGFSSNNFDGYSANILLPILGTINIFIGTFLAIFDIFVLNTTSYKNDNSMARFSLKTDLLLLLIKLSRVLIYLIPSIGDFVGYLYASIGILLIYINMKTSNFYNKNVDQIAKVYINVLSFLLISNLIRTIFGSYGMYFCCIIPFIVILSLKFNLDRYEDISGVNFQREVGRVIPHISFYKNLLNSRKERAQIYLLGSLMTDKKKFCHFGRLVLCKTDEEYEKLVSEISYDELKQIINDFCESVLNQALLWNRSIKFKIYSSSFFFYFSNKEKARELLNSIENEKMSFFDKIQFYMLKIENEKSILLSRKKDEKNIYNINIYNYERIEHAFFEEIKKAAEAHAMFWDCLINSSPDSSKLISLAIDLSMKRDNVLNIWNTLQNIIPDKIDTAVIYAKYLKEIAFDKSLSLSIIKRSKNTEQTNLLFQLNENYVEYPEKCQSPIIQINAEDVKLGIIKNVNQAFCRELGYMKAEVINKSINIFMPKPIAEVHNEILKDFYKNLNLNEKTVKNKEIKVPILTKMSYLVPSNLEIIKFPNLNEGLTFIGKLSIEGYSRHNEEILYLLINQQLEVINISSTAITYLKISHEILNNINNTKIHLSNIFPQIKNFEELLASNSQNSIETICREIRFKDNFRVIPSNENIQDEILYKCNIFIFKIKLGKFPQFLNLIQVLIPKGNLNYDFTNSIHVSTSKKSDTVLLKENPIKFGSASTEYISRRKENTKKENFNFNNNYNNNINKNINLNLNLYKNSENNSPDLLEIFEEEKEKENKNFNKNSNSNSNSKIIEDENKEYDTTGKLLEEIKDEDNLNQEINNNIVENKIETNLNLKNLKTQENSDNKSSSSAKKVTNLIQKNIEILRSLVNKTNDAFSEESITFKLLNKNPLNYALDILTYRIDSQGLFNSIDEVQSNEFVQVASNIIEKKEEDKVNSTIKPMDDQKLYKERINSIINSSSTKLINLVWSIIIVFNIIMPFVYQQIYYSGIDTANKLIKQSQIISQLYANLMYSYNIFYPHYSNLIYNNTIIEYDPALEFSEIERLQASNLPLLKQLISLNFNESICDPIPTYAFTLNSTKSLLNEYLYYIYSIEHSLSNKINSNTSDDITFLVNELRNKIEKIFKCFLTKLYSNSCSLVQNNQNSSLIIGLSIGLNFVFSIILILFIINLLIRTNNCLGMFLAYHESSFAKLKENALRWVESNCDFGKMEKLEDNLENEKEEENMQEKFSGNKKRSFKSLIFSPVNLIISSVLIFAFLDIYFIFILVYYPLWVSFFQSNTALIESTIFLEPSYSTIIGLYTTQKLNSSELVNLKPVLAKLIEEIINYKNQNKYFEQNITLMSNQDIYKDAISLSTCGNIYPITDCKKLFIENPNPNIFYALDLGIYFIQKMLSENEEAQIKENYKILNDYFLKITQPLIRQISLTEIKYNEQILNNSQEILLIASIVFAFLLAGIYILIFVFFFLKASNYFKYAHLALHFLPCEMLTQNVKIKNYLGIKTSQKSDQ